MALRKPVIGGINTPGLRGVLEYGRVGVLVDVRSSDAIADGMVQLAMSEELRERISNAAYEKSWAEYRADVVLPRYEYLYEECDANALRASTAKTCERGTA
jgi:glycosyltransferase involved in cell wall biosynthesis